MIQDGKGIEINTSNFRHGLSDLAPSRPILKWYYELGGKVLTIGLDSHEESHLGLRLKRAKKS